MARYSFRENDPITRWNEIPIYLTTILTALFVVGVLLTAAGAGIQHLNFVLPGSAWNLITISTYPFVGSLDLFSLFAIYFFYQMSIGLETHLGRSKLLKLLGLFAAIPALVGAVACYGYGHPVILAGNFFILTGVIAAFATLYPSAKALGFISFRSIACAYLAVLSLIALSSRNWIQFYGLWAVAFAAFLYIRHCQEQEYDDVIPLGVRIRGLFRRKPAFRVVPPPKERESAPKQVSEESDAELDALLDKIAKSGLASLTSAEKAKLEKARQELLRKERP